MRRPLILAIVVGTFLTLPLAAQNCTDTVTWTGAVNTDWNTTGNWSPARVPTQSDTVTIPVGKTVTNQPGAGLGTGFICSLTLDGTLTIDTSALILLSATITSTLNNLTLTAAQGTSGLTVNGSATFTGNLVLNPGQVSGPGMATINGTVKVGKGPSFLTTATVNNEGSIAVTQDGVQLTLGTGVFNNDGAIALQGDGITVIGGGTFANSRFGSISKSKGPGASSFSSTSQFSTAGTVSGQTGTLVFSASGTSTGAFNADGTLQFANRVTMNAGTTVGGAGTIDIVAGGVWDVETPLAVNSGQLIFDGAAGNLILGNSDVTINSQVTWNGGWLGTSGGSAKATFTKNVTIATAASHASFRTLDIFATVTMNADLSMNAPNSTAPTITIEPGATFNIGTDNGIHGQCTINNGGTFAKTGGSQVSVLDYSGTFNTVTSGKPTVGMVSVTSGVLDFATSNGGEIGGNWTVSSPATLEFGAGNYALAQGTIFSGSGTTLLTIAGNWTVDATAFVNSSVFDFGGALGGGTITGEGHLTVNSPTFSWEGSAPGTMQGSGSPLNPGVTNISSGTTLTIRSGNKNVIGRAVFNAGTTKIADGSALFLGGLGETDWNNLAGSTFSFDADGSIKDGGGGTVFTNDGTVTKTGGNGTSNISFSGTFDSGPGGTVSANSGTLNLAASNGGALAGSWTANGTMEFSAGTYDLAPAIGISGSGTILLTTANWNLAGDISLNASNFEFDGVGFNSGTITGSGDLTVNSANFTWTGGWMQGPGATTISAATTLTIKIANPANWPVVSGRTVNAGTTKIADSQRLALGQGAVWNNKNVFSFEADGNISNNAGGATFNNDGTVQKTGGSLSTIAFTGTINNNASGQIVARSGTIILKPSSGTSAGAFIAQGASTRIGFSSGQWTMDEGTTMSGGGAILSQTTWILQADLNVTSTTFVVTNGSSIKGGANLTLSSSDITLGGVRIGINQNGQAVGTLIIPNGSSVVKVPTIFGLGMCTFRSSSAHMTITSMGILDIGDNATALIEQGGQITLDSPPPPNGPGKAVVLDQASSTFSNSGTLTLGTDSGADPMQAIVSRLSPPAGRFDNNGTVFVPGSRTLTLSVGVGAVGGTYAVSGGGVLAFQDGTYNLESHAAMSGAGAISLGGTFQVDEDTTVKPALFQFGPIFGSNGVSGGLLRGSAALTLSGTKVSCFGGTVAMTPPGSATLAANTSFVPSGPPVCQLAGGTVNNSGTFEFDTGGIDIGGGTIFNNSGTMDFQGSNSISGGSGTATINNSGTVQSSGNNAIQYSGPFNNSGNVSVGAGGQLQFGGSNQPVTYTQTGSNSSTSVSGGTLSTSGTFNFNEGVVGGPGAINGGFNNVGATLEAGGSGGQRARKPASGTGILNLSGGEKQGSNSTLLVVIAGTTPGTQYDQINEANSIIGNGTLKLQFASGFTPAPTNTFDIVNFASGSGTLKNVITNSPTCKAVLVPTTKALNVKFTSTNVSVNINPPTVTLHENQQQQFTDTVSNGCGSGVTWKVNESNGGTVDQNGLYTAPERTGTFHVVVTSIADPSKFAFSTVTVIAARNQLVVTPPAALLRPGTTLLLRANRPVMWSIAEGKSAGSVSVGGRYTAPLRPGLYHVVATSTTDPSQHAVANISVVGGKLKFAYVANIDKDLISVLLPGSDAAAIGPLHETASVATGQKPAALALSPKGKLLLSANADSNDVSVFAISAASGTLHAVAGASSATGAQPSAVAFDPSGKFAFTTNSGSDDVSIFSVAASGQLTLLGSHALPAGEAPRAIAVHPQGSLVFVAATGSNKIHGFTLNAGSLKEIAGSPFDAGTAPTALTMDASGQFLFVANHDSGDISVFSIDAKKESLRQVSGSPFQAGKAPAALALDLTGSYLFVADHDSDDITTFQINGETGVLNRLGRTPLPAADPSALAVDPSGQSLYVVSDQSASMTTLRMDVATGMLTATGKTQGRGKASSIVLAGTSTGKP